MDYKTIAPSYNELYAEEQKKKLNVLLSLILINKDWIILDIGAGTGIIQKEIRCTVISLEPEKRMLEQAKGKRVCGKAEYLPFKNRSVDGIVCVTVIHHCNESQALKEMFRVLKPNGFIFITLLKKAKRVQEIREYLKKFNPVIQEEEKDICFLIKKEQVFE
ncbi:class I SAM-dependent methyltransferase [Candidatus Woesearchaeota archaeon]|nr:class I SAM-dependent methyltransferase [Candidatus Woesearchaeota archaeon]